MKKKIKVYMLITRSKVGRYSYTLDVYRFLTREKRRDFMEKIIGRNVECDFFDDEMEMDI